MAGARLPLVLHHLRRLADDDGPDVSDAQLLERFVTARDSTAFELLVWRHQHMVLSVCRRTLGHLQDAEDAFQATFLALARKAASISRAQSVAAWLHRVAVRVALRARAKAARLAEQPIAEDDLPPSPHLGPAEAAAWRDVRQFLDLEVACLPDQYRIPVVLCYLEGRSYDEVGRALGCSRGTVATRLARARDLLRKRLIRRGLMLSAGGLAALFAGQASAAPAFIDVTVKAALLFAAGRTADTIRTRAADLATGVLHAMFLTKLKTMASAVLAVAILVAGVGSFLFRVDAGEQPSSRPGPATLGDTPGTAKADRPAVWAEYATLKGKPTSAVFSSDGTKVTTAGPDGSVLEWDVATGQPTGRTRQLELDKTMNVQALALSPDTRWLVTGLAALVQSEPNGRLQIWELRSPQKVDRPPQATQVGGVGSPVTAVAFAADSKHVAFGSQTRVGVAVASTAKVVWEAKGHKSPVVALAFSPDGKRLASAASHPYKFSNGLPVPPGWELGGIKLWDAEGGHQLWSEPLTEVVTSLAFAPDGKSVAVAGVPNCVFLLDAATGKQMARLEGFAGQVRSLAFTPDGKLLAGGCDDGVVRLWGVPTLKEAAVLEPNAGAVQVVAFSPGGQTLLTAGDSIKLWKLKPAVDSPAAPAASRLDRLIAELAKGGVGDKEAIDGLFLAVLGRFPTETERSLLQDTLKKSSDRKATLTEIARQLIATTEFRENVEELGKRLNAW